MKLYEINELIEAALNVPEGENFDSALIEELAIRFDEKVENCIAYLKNLRAEEDALSLEIKRLQGRKASVENHRKSLSNYVQAELEKAGRNNIKTGIHKARLQNNPPKVIITHQAKVPEEFRTIETREVVLKSKIQDHFKTTGEILPGTDIIKGKHLRIS